MNKTTIKSDFIDFAYSPIDINFNQRILQPVKKKIIIKGVRFLRDNNNKEIKIFRKNLTNII